MHGEVPMIVDEVGPIASFSPFVNKLEIIGVDINASDDEPSFDAQKHICEITSTRQISNVTRFSCQCPGGGLTCGKQTGSRNQTTSSFQLGTV